MLTDADTLGRTVDRGLALPVWAQVARDLRRTIAQEMTAGDQLPSENELTKVYGVSRITIRQALAKLEEEGAIERRQGRGTFIAESRAHVSHDLTIAEPWRLRFEREGHSSGSVQVAVNDDGRVRASVRKSLSVEPNAKIVRLRRVHEVDGIRIGLVDSWVPEGVAPGIGDQPLDQGSLTTTLRGRYGINFSKAEGWMTVGELSTEESELLGCPPGTGAFVVDEVLRDANGRPLAYSVTRWWGPGVRFRFATQF